MADSRMALRTLRHDPAFTSASVVTIALVVGLATSVMSVVDNIILRPLPMAGAERMVLFCEHMGGLDDGFCVSSPPNVTDLAARVSAIEVAGVAREWAFAMRLDGPPVGVRGGIATAGALEAAGFRAAIGRLFDSTEVGPGRDRVVVLTDRLWRERFGADQSVIGRSIVVEGEPHSVIGVLPARARFPTLEDVELWKPLHLRPTDEEARGWAGFAGIARLAPGTPMVAVAAEVGAVARDLKRTYFGDKPDWSLQVRPVSEVVVGRMRQTLLLFLGAAALVFLIGYSNVAALFLARGISRSREGALRAALGASRWDVARVMLAECAVVSVAGTVVGLLIAAWLTPLFVTLAPADLPRLGDVQFDTRVALLSAVPSLVVGLVFGVFPVLRTSRGDIRSVLSDGTRTVGNMHGSRTGRALVVGEVALAVALLAGASLLARSFRNQVTWDPGIDRSRVFTSWVFLSGVSGNDAVERFARVADTLRAIPGVASVSYGSAGPVFGGVETEDFSIGGRAGTSMGSVRWFDAGPGFFSTLGIPLVKGRAIEASDGPGAAPVAVINERMAALAFGTEDPIGRTIVMSDRKRNFEVVGVARDVRSVNPSVPVQPQMYWPMAQEPRVATYLIVRSAGPAATVRRALEQRIASADPDMQVGAVRSLDDALQARLAAPRFTFLLVAAFSAVALVLSMVGTYGLHAYAVALRTREFGVRMALGGRPRALMGEVLRESMGLAGIAVLLGIPLAMVLGRSIHSMLAGVSAWDPMAMLVSTVGLVGASVLAAVIPARRAMRVDPMVAMRAE